MKFNILNVEDNRNFLENKKYELVIQNDDGTATIKYNMSAFCDRVWLDNEFTFKTGFEYIYEIKLSTGETWETKIIEKGKDENGHFIVLIVPGAMEHAYEGIERPSVPICQIDVNLVLSPDLIKGSDLLLSEFYNEWPSFHDADLVIVKRTADEIILRFSDGYLCDKVVDVIMNDIISEVYDDGLEYFSQWLTGVEFRSKNDLFELRLYNDYSTSSYPESFDRTMLQDPDFDMSSLKDIRIVEEFKNHGIIQCKSMELIVKIDEVKKRKLEEEDKEFLEDGLK